MKILVTTSESFLAWDADNQRCSRLHSGSGPYYGVCYSEENIFVAARRFDAAKGVNGSRGVILVFDYKLQLVDRFESPFPLRDVHQILYVDSRLFAIKGPTGWTCWRPLGRKLVGENQRSRRHFNSLLYANDRVYLLAHNFGRSDIFEFEARTLELTRSISLGMSAHNLWFQDGVMHTCNSAEHSIVSETREVARPGDFPRGIAVTNAGVYLGVTKYSADRDERGRQDPMIAHFAPDWSFRQAFQLKGEGTVYDIRCPGRADASHPHIVGQALDLSLVQSEGPMIAVSESRFSDGANFKMVENGRG
jgi:hypothetical protein